MQIYKTNFPTQQQGKDYLLNLGVILEVENEIVFAPTTAAVVYIGKVVETPGTYGPDGHEITPPVYYPGFAIDVMSSSGLDFGTYAVYPADASAHSFYGWAKNAEVPPKEAIINTKLDPEVKIIVDVEDKAKAIIEE